MTYSASVGGDSRVYNNAISTTNIKMGEMAACISSGARAALSGTKSGRVTRCRSHCDHQTCAVQLARVSYWQLWEQVLVSCWPGTQHARGQGQLVANTKRAHRLLNIISTLEHCQRGTARASQELQQLLHVQCIKNAMKTRGIDAGSSNGTNPTASSQTGTTAIEASQRARLAKEATQAGRRRLRPENSK